MKDDKNIKQYYTQAEIYEYDLDEGEIERIQHIKKEIPKDAKSILETGCGDGRNINSLNGKRLIIGLDFSKPALKQVKKPVILGSSNSLPFCNNSFDLVIASELLEHLDDNNLKITLSEIMRVSKKYILVTVPYMEWPWETNVICDKCNHIFSPYGHKQFFDNKRIQNLLGYDKGQSKDIRIKIGYISTKRYYPVFKRIGQIFLRCYNKFRKSVVCPKCGSRKVKTEFGKLSDLYYTFMVDYLKKYARIKPKWIMCLYELNFKTISKA